MLVLALANASPITTSATSKTTTFALLSSSQPHTTAITSSSSSSPLAHLGTALSWLSTTLYLASRLPQLLKNHSRRSTAGLSISLFIAAFFGNLFYSTSLLANPLAWSDYAPNGAHGWAPAEGSIQTAWLANAAPFFFGAAGVLGLDAMVAAQFWWFGREARQAARVEDERVRVEALAKASLVSERLDSERTLVSSRDGTTLPVAIITGVDEGVPEGVVVAGSSGAEVEPVLVVGHKVMLDYGDEDGLGTQWRWSWKEVDGWMRGWKPSYRAIAAGNMRGKGKGKGRSGLGVETFGGEPEGGVGRAEEVLEGSETQALLGER